MCIKRYGRKDRADGRTDRAEGPGGQTGRKDRAEGPGGRTDRAEGRTGRKDRSEGQVPVLPQGNNRSNSIGNSIGNYIKKLTFKKWHFELNIKWNSLIKGFPGLLNTIGTLLDRSWTVLQKVKKSEKWGGPMGPGGTMGPGPRDPGPKKTKKFLKWVVFLNMEKTRTEILCLEQSSIIQNH